MRIFSIKCQTGITRNNIFAPKTQSNNSVSFASKNNNSGFSKVDETLYRGSIPNSEQLSKLNELGVSTIIDLTPVSVKTQNYNEADCARELGMKHVRIPLITYSTPTDKQVKQFIKEIELAKKNKQKVYIHCQDNGNRTDFLVELYKIKFVYENWDLETSKKALRDKGYNFAENPDALPLLRNFAKKCSNSKHPHWPYKWIR